MERVSYQRQGRQEERGATWREVAEAATQQEDLPCCLLASCVTCYVCVFKSVLNTSSFFAHAESQLRT